MRQFGVRRVLPVLLTVLRAILPRCRWVFVIGYPETEGNAVETVRALARRYRGRIYWAQAPSAAYLERIGIGTPPALRPVAKSSPLTMLRYAMAELVFFTHGVYGEPAATPRKPTVNLWHGAGMKWAGPLFPLRRMRALPSDVIMAPSRLWGGRTAEFSGLDDSQTLLLGYPRNDQLFRPAAPATLSALGIDGDFVVWLPSYRTARAQGTMPALHDGVDPEGDRRLTEQFAEVVATLARHGIRTVVKPHPMDAIARAVPGAVVIDDDQLERHGVGLYSLLGAACGLISDTSSVWSDFLLLDRPIGFFFPDREDYVRGRGVYPADVLDWLPGPFLDTPESVESFARSLRSQTSDEQARRRVTIERAGLVRTRTAADDMLTELSSRFPHLASAIEAP